MMERGSQEMEKNPKQILRESEEICPLGQVTF